MIKYKILSCCETDGDAEIIVKANDSHLLIGEIDSYCRGILKYGSEISRDDALQAIRDSITESGYNRDI